MSEKNSKANEAVGADQTDISEHESGEGVAPPAEPSNTPPKDETSETDTETKEGQEEETPEGEGEAEGEGEGEGEDDQPKELDTDTWGTTGDEVGDSVLHLLQNSGISTEDAKALLYDAVQQGDVTKVDRAALEEKVGKQNATLILAGTENFVAKQAQRVNTIKTTVHEAAGGEDNWNAITGWANKNVPESELQEYRDLIDAGGAKARFAASDLLSRYNSDSKNTSLDTGGSTETKGDTKPNNQARAISKADYVRELEKAYDSGASETVIQEINAARARGRKQGI